eukprot:sb/3468623/
MQCRTLLSIYSARKHMTSKTIKILGDYTHRELTKQGKNTRKGTKTHCYNCYTQGRQVLTLLTGVWNSRNYQTTKHDKGIIKEKERGRVGVYLTDCVSGALCQSYSVYLCVKTLREHFSCIYPATSISARSRGSRVQISPCKWSRGAGVIFALAAVDLTSLTVVPMMNAFSLGGSVTVLKTAQTEQMKLPALHRKLVVPESLTTSPGRPVVNYDCTSESWYAGEVVRDHQSQKAKIKISRKCIVLRCATVCHSV